MSANNLIGSEFKKKSSGIEQKIHFDYIKTIPCFYFSEGPNQNHTVLPLAVSYRKTPLSKKAMFYERKGKAP